MLPLHLTPSPRPWKSLPLRLLLLFPFFFPATQTKRGAHEYVCLVKFNFDGGTSKAAKRFSLSRLPWKCRWSHAEEIIKKEEVFCHLRLSGSRSLPCLKSGVVSAPRLVEEEISLPDFSFFSNVKFSDALHFVSKPLRLVRPNICRTVLLHKSAPHQCTYRRWGGGGSSTNNVLFLST